MIDHMFVFSPAEILITGISSGLFLILSLYYFVIYARPLRAMKQKGQVTPSSTDALPPISIIIYAKNDSDNLRKHLPSLLSQEYPEYEVIVVNDGSSDETDDTLKFLENHHKNLYHTYIPADVRYVSHRKLALTLGVKAAKHEILVFTESNCQPVSEHWLSAIASGYAKAGTQIVLGYCAYGSYKGVKQKMIAYDNLQTGLRYLSQAIAGMAYTGNGRNLSYRKDLFMRHKGYIQSLSLHSGDDDLFINEAATRDNTTAVCTANSLMEMDKIERFATWKEMKVSRAATERYYKGSTSLFFHMESLFFFLFTGITIALFIIGLMGNWLLSIWAGMLLVCRFITKLIIFRKSSLKLRQAPMSGWLLILEFFSPLYNAYIHIYRASRSKKDYTFRLVE